MPFRSLRIDILLMFTIAFVSCTAATFGQSGTVDSEYPRGPMRASGAIRQPIRVAQLNPLAGQAPSTDFGMTPVPGDNFGPVVGPPPAVNPNFGSAPFPGQLPANPNPGFNPGINPEFNPNFNPNLNPGFSPNAGVGGPNFADPRVGAPALGGQNLYENGAYGNGAYDNGAFNNGYGAPNPNLNTNQNVFGSSDLFRTPYDEVSPFGRQPLSPYGQTDFSEDVVDADLLIGLTPSLRTLNYGAGVGYNSDLGVFGQFIYDDRDFDWRAFPWLNPPVPFRGGGQRLRIEAMPGANAQRYLASFTEPYFAQWAGQPVALSLSGFYFERDYFDWDERRFGGRVGLSYYLTQTLQLSAKFRIENVDISDPRVPVPELVRSLGDSELFGASIGLAHDTRDSPYAPTRGSYLSASYEHVFGTFDYPRGIVQYKNFTTLWQRPDDSGRQVLGLHFDGGITGSQTPIFENFFAGGFSTLRGFRFRHASPKDQGVIVGGELSLLGSAEYFFPITADDMVRGVLFTDFGSLSRTTDINNDDFRLSVGGGLRLIIPALGPAPLAIDAAVPLIRDGDDRVQNIAFLISVGR